MYNTIGLTRGLSLTKIIGGLSKTLQVANQLIPLYQKTKPVLNNAKNILSVLKEMNKTPKNKEISIENPKAKTNIEEATYIEKKENSSSPTFFL